MAKTRTVGKKRNLVKKHKSRKYAKGKLHKVDSYIILYYIII